MQEEKEDPCLISDAESAIKDSLITEISGDASNLGEEHSGRIPFGGIRWHSSWAEDWDLYDGDLDDWHFGDSEDMIEDDATQNESSNESDSSGSSATS